MIRIRQLGEPPIDAHWSYGKAFMRRISMPNARALCGMFPLPPMGSETVVALKRDGSFNQRLCVQNISGHYYLASCDTGVKRWPEVFGVEIVE